MATCLKRSRMLISSRILKREMGLTGNIFKRNLNKLCTRGDGSSGDNGSIATPYRVCVRGCGGVSAPAGLGNSLSALFSVRRFESVRAEGYVKLQEEEEVGDHDAHEQALDFPGGKVTFTSQIQFISGSPEKRIPCYRVLNDEALLIGHGGVEQVKQKLAIKIYTNMVRLQMMDAMFYETQRQGRISFYLTSTGEEAINIASAAALNDDDVILAQYREPGVLMWRGFSLQEFADQCFGNKADYGKGRQMPIHYGSNKHNYFTISSPLSTQIPQAVGVAYSLKMDKKDACVVVYFGDGGSSEGDFHAGMNFAAVMEAPVIFLCRNNGWAISTHISEQFRSDGVAVKGQGYGIRSIRVDGNDALAVYNAVRKAREIAVKEQASVLIEALTYRVSHHSTSDDSTKYRPVGEIEYWKVAHNPVTKFRKWVERNGWWSDREESELRNNIRKELMKAIQTAEKTEKPPLEEMFNDVYDTTPLNLREQEKHLREAIEKYPQDYPLDVPL